MTLIERLKRLVPGGRDHSASTVANVQADAAYDAAMVQELEAYADVANVHDFPQIFHYWSNKYVRPKFEHVGLSSPTDVFTKILFAGVCI